MATIKWVHLMVELWPGLLEHEFFETSFGLARDGMSYPQGWATSSNALS